MLFREVVDAAEAVRATRSRNAKTEALASLITRLGDAAPIGVAYLMGQLPQGKIGIGFATIAALDMPEHDGSALTVDDVHRTLDHVASISGSGSKRRRLAALGDLFAMATPDEQEFLRRLLIGNLRQGALEGVMLDAIAKASGVAAASVRRAAMLSGDVSGVVTAALEGGVSALDAYRLELFRPLQPMLAQTAEDVSTAIAKIDDWAADAKYDGARIQVHVSGERIEVYTRNLRRVTGRMPEIVDIVRRMGLGSGVFDGEAMGTDGSGEPLPFQVTMGRFGTETAEDHIVGLMPVFFDCLHLNGDDLIDAPLYRRLEALDEAVPATYRSRRVTGSLDDAEAFNAGVLEAGHEGIMVKDRNSPYEAGRRGAAWLKVKPAHTLDLVVLAAEWGSGRRQGWLSNIHLGARSHDGFVMLGKTFKGMTDDMLKWQTQRFLELEERREGHVVYLRPEQVVEVAFDGLQASSRYPGSVALRFARVKRYRQDKSAAEADTMETVLRIFKAGYRSHDG